MRRNVEIARMLLFDYIIITFVVNCLSKDRQRMTLYSPERNLDAHKYEYINLRESLLTIFEVASLLVLIVSSGKATLPPLKKKWGGKSKQKYTTF